MRWLAIVFLVLIAALQYPIWLGKGGWLRVRELNAQVAAQRETNADLKARNEAFDAEVRDLKQGVEAVEERARSELGMIRHDEIFFQLAPGDAPAPVSSPPKDPVGPDSSRQRSANESGLVVPISGK
jgi:cell division protein FtsB